MKKDRQNEEKIENERWRPVVGFETLYEVSDYGRVKRLGHYYINHGKPCYKEDFLLKPYKNIDGYLTAVLKDNNGKIKRCFVHRLVAEAFIENPDNKPYVNHKNQIRDDNCVTNLNWATPYENLHWGDCLDKIKKRNKSRQKFYNW